MTPVPGRQESHSVYLGPNNPFMSLHMVKITAAAVSGYQTTKLPHPVSLLQGLVPQPHGIYS